MIERVRKKNNKDVFPQHQLFMLETEKRLARLSRIKEYIERKKENSFVSTSNEAKKKGRLLHATYDIK